MNLKIHKSWLCWQGGASFWGERRSLGWRNHQSSELERFLDPSLRSGWRFTRIQDNGLCILRKPCCMRHSEANAEESSAEKRLWILHYVQDDENTERMEWHSGGVSLCVRCFEVANKKRRLNIRWVFLLRVPGLEPGAVWRPAEPKCYEKWDEARPLANTTGWYRSLMAHGGSSFSISWNEKQKRPILRLVFSSAGARTRTWSLLVRSQTLYPVGLHPRFVFFRWRAQI